MCTWVECEGRGLCPVASQPVRKERSVTDIMSGRELARVCQMSDTEEVGQVCSWSVSNSFSVIQVLTKSTKSYCVWHVCTHQQFPLRKKFCMKPDMSWNIEISRINSPSMEIRPVWE